MNAFLSIKFWGDNRNREDIERIIEAIEGAGFRVSCFVRDAEKWGENYYEPAEMMRLTFNQIDQSDFVVANVADWPIGVGVEAGYAYAKGIPVICICPLKARMANTVAGLARHFIQYESYDELSKRLAALNY